MRLVTWNVCDGFTRKFGHLERLKPDIAVLQEVRPGCLAYAGLSDRAIWIGDEGQKGLVAVSYGEWTLARALLDVNERWFVPIVASNGATKIHLVAVWVDSSSECGPPTLRALKELRDFIAAAPTILAGDFNQCVAMDARKGPGRRFADVLSAIEGLGLESAWHATSGEKQGEESAATLFWTWNAERKFHIDFVFHSQSLTVGRAAIGTYENYVAAKISDHVPITVDFALSVAG
jgi:endonuclease/exonuclease/phosphatase family metal-dependent hydrolase